MSQFGKKLVPGMNDNLFLGIAIIVLETQE